MEFEPNNIMPKEEEKSTDISPYVLGGPDTSDKKVESIVLRTDLENEIGSQEFKEKVKFIAQQISGWSRKMSFEDYRNALDVENLSPEVDGLSVLISKAIFEPSGNTEKLTEPANIKVFLDSFEHGIGVYIDDVSRHAQTLNLSGGDVIKKLRDIEKYLSSWGNDE